MLKIIDHDGVRELRLDRPPVNALNPALVKELTAALQKASSTAGAIVLSGREGMFSAGLDVPELLRLERAAMSAFWEAFFGLLETVARCPVPVAAAITGHAPAGGAVLSLFCDYRVMTRGKYRIGLNETRVGLIVPAVIRGALVRVTGAHTAERLIVAGSLLGADEARQAGILDDVVDDPESAVSQALRWCRQHLELPSAAMLGNRELARGDLHRLFDELSGKDVDSFVDGWFQESTQETLHAMVANLKKK